MRVLLITGQLARKDVERYARESQVEFEVRALPVAVAALLTPRLIASHLQGKNLASFDIVLTPGLVRGDLSTVEDDLGVPIYKGPRHAADLPFVLRMLPEAKLSKTIPASDVLRAQLRQNALKEIEDTEGRREELLEKPWDLLLGRGGSSIAIGRDFPARVIAEILDAPLLSDEELRRQALYYAGQGADIIDVGMVAGEVRTTDAERAVRVVKEAVRLPVSIDSLNPDEIEAAISAGADLVLSLDGSNVDSLPHPNPDVGFVVIPTSREERAYPLEAEERVERLQENIERARRRGVRRIIGDLILDPVGAPGVLEALVAYRLFRKKDPHTPLLLGAGNVTELMDADSPGVNALLAAVGSEVSASLILTTEGSQKTRGSVSELSKAAKMMFLAKRRRSPPKDLGLDLLVLKEKRLKEEPYHPSVEEGVEILEAPPSDEFPRDPAGYFKVLIDRANARIAALHFRPGDAEPDVILKGEDSENICRTMVERGLVSKLDHASYMGRELQKAEVALKLDRSYVQDSSLFFANDGG